MCILCVVQRWSRRAIGMLPWLVIPLILLWAVSQLLPPGLRFEITSPRLACVAVLLGTIFWYEILLPQLSVYRALRRARIREQQLSFAVEVQKLRKTATRRCRNCLAPYRDQNPGGGKFMCSYCGHLSKRPILDLPGPPGRSGVLGNLIGKNGWFWNLECSAQGGGHWDGHGSHASRHWAGGVEEQGSEEEACSRGAVFTWRLLSSFFSFTSRFCGKVMKLGSLVEDGVSGAEHKGSSKGIEHVGQGSKGEKARRKAEEKRLARLEKEMLEEEERKQREEVARLIEERRKLRDEQMEEANKERLKVLALDGSRGGGKEESDKRRRSRKKEKDKNSSKSNSDGEDHDSRVDKEAERKREFERKNDHAKQDSCRNQRMHAEVASGVVGAAHKSKYFDGVKGASLSSSRSSNGWTLFGKNSHSVTVPGSRSNKPVVGNVDKGQRKDAGAVVHASGEPSSNGDSGTSGNACPRPVALDPTQTSTPKKAWHQLFARPSLRPSPEENVGKKVDQTGNPEGKSSDLADGRSPSQPSTKQMLFEQSLALTNDPSTNGSLSNIPSSPTVSESRVPLSRELGHNSRTEKELFQDPCFVPDPASMIGSISESRDNHSAGSGSDFKDDFISDSKSRSLRKVCDSTDVKRPSPIESPLSKLWMSKGRHTGSGSGSGSCSPNLQDPSALPEGESKNVNEQGTWQMWSSSLCKDGLDLVGGPASWLSALEQDRVTPDAITRPPAENPVTSVGVMEKNILRSTFKHSDSVCTGNPGDDGLVSPFTAKDPWFSPLHSFPGDGENHFPHPRFHGGVAQEETFGSPNIYASGLPLDQSQAYYCPGNWAAAWRKNVGIPNPVRPPHLGRFFLPASMYSQPLPARSLQGTRQQDGTLRRL
ncbi:unnamed protein product [Spirodela intermedia]|uniref:Uncharacterized protein n=1 Tax=Spirodela intermedia TaxID=51605 RepID=A0A7I8K7J8_SPIIN|nr:unnamed protein product [Spirodela intermedia]